jgi:iron-sulfur cluster repair protein YtfE (RIC family)
MKRIEALIPYSSEHHQSLCLAKQCINTAKTNDAAAIQALCTKIVNTFEAELDEHFKREEHHIFPAVKQHQPELAELCLRLEAEHQQFRDLYESVKTGNYSVLEAFGTLLKEHTRTEERELFDKINIFTLVL